MTIDKGIEFLENNEPQKALEIFSKLHEQNRDSVEVMLHMIEALDDLGKDKEVVKLYEEILKLNPKDNDTILEYGEYLLENEKIEDAIKILSKVEGPNLHEAKIQIALAYMFEENYKNAEKILLELKEQKKDDPYIAMLLGDMYYKSGDMDKAYINLKHSVLLEETAQSLSSLAAIYYDMDELDEAEKCAVKAVKLDETEANSYLILGQIYLSDEKIKEAIDNFELFIKYEDTEQAKELIEEVNSIIAELKLELK